MIRALVMSIIGNKEQSLEFSTISRRVERLPMASEAHGMLLKCCCEQQTSPTSGNECVPLLSDTFKDLSGFERIVQKVGGILYSTDHCNRISNGLDRGYDRRFNTCNPFTDPIDAGSQERSPLKNAFCFVYDPWYSSQS